MTEASAMILLATAVSIAFVHNLVGVDHGLPFVVLAKARKWSLRKALGVTAICGLGHVVGSILLGLIGISIGIALQKLEWIEDVRGHIAAWGLIAFGLMYAAWGIVKQRRGHRHSHAHTHEDGTTHSHDHDHHGEHLHPHENSSGSLTFWSLFIVFAFGPCEALIPLLMTPAWAHDWWVVFGVTAAFSIVTIGTMVGMVALGVTGLKWVPLKKFEQHAQFLAGMAIATSGLAIQVLGHHH